ncbi:MAG: hypothetical protein C4567_08355 [Deltaproteobacteria bacterium]|nr:MAG: hypothetical protein C4567_08355 [Deltaproteobacteria bacterium]
MAALLLAALLRKKPTPRTAPSPFIRWFLPLRRRPWIAFLLMGLLAFAAGALLPVFIGRPQPAVHDEFGYLLAADTFAQGRLANPPHPLWQHFETFHVLHHPTYASKYPPAQGVALALGQALTGCPIVGVWLSVGLACAAVCWMLAGWVPFRWALLGGFLALIRIVFSGPHVQMAPFPYWSQSYWGGAVAALGGALVFGALPRIIKNQKPRDALWLALGLAILANSRPFEGLAASIPALAVLGIWLLRTRRVTWRNRFRRVVLPSALVLTLAVSWMGLYNYRVTGDPLRLPYQAHEAAYAIVPLFLWQPLKTEPPYNHEILRDFHRGSIGFFQSQQSLKGWLDSSIYYKLKNFWLFYFGLIFIPPMLLLAASPKSWRRPNVIFPLAVCLLMVAALLANPYFFPHYAAPITCLAILLQVESLRRMRRFSWRGRPMGRTFVNGFLPALLASTVIAFPIYDKPSKWILERARILRELEQSGEPHLVIVRYGRNHSLHHEWVYNRADLNNAKVIWAREMGAEADRELLDYFKDRRVWLLEADQRPPRLAPYSGVYQTSDR